MKKIFIFICAIITGISQINAQDISGYWQGVSYQQSGGLSPYYPASLELFQNGNVITGFSSARMPDGSPVSVKSKIEGNINNTALFYQLTGIVEQVPPPFPFYWCPNGYANLVYDPATQTLKGPSNSPGCAGAGSVELWRLAVLSDTIFCKGQDINLVVTGKDVRWYSDKALNNAVNTGNTFSPDISVSTTYYVTQTHYSTESPAIALRIVIKEPRLTIVDKTICAGQSFEGYAASGSYTDTLASATGCDSIRQLRLTVTPLTINEVSGVVCPGVSYLGYNSPGRYVDTITDAAGCSLVRILHLSHSKLPEPDLGTPLSLCVGDTVHLSPGTFDAYLWNNGSTDSIMIVSGYGTYRVSVTNSCGSATAQVNITTGDCNVMLPTAFSPNGDGLNDVFKPLKLNSATSYSFEIFNRWGQRVFKSTNPNEGWDGKVNGRIQSPGMYVYKLVYTRQSKPDVRKGVVTITASK